MHLLNIVLIIGLVTLIVLLPRLRSRILLSKAKHRSLSGHAQLAKSFAKLVPYYEFGEPQFFTSDHAPESVAHKRKHGFTRLALHFKERNPQSIRIGARLAAGISDVQFVSRYRVPFQYSQYT